jgi:hypothetical protein
VRIKKSEKKFFNRMQRRGAPRARACQWTLIGIGQWADPSACQRNPRESEGGRCAAPSGPSDARVLASELAETLSPDGPAPTAGRREPSDSLQTEPQREAHLPGPVSVDSHRPRRLALRVPHARDLPSSYPRRLVAPAPISGRRRRH